MADPAEHEGNIPGNTRQVRVIRSVTSSTKSMMMRRQTIKRRSPQKNKTPPSSNPSSQPVTPRPQPVNPSPQSVTPKPQSPGADQSAQRQQSGRVDFSRATAVGGKSTQLLSWDSQQYKSQFHQSN
ncbi:hypothetical protein PCASD_09417 [Puccinia coronata f. sp. avenae]|uniref:Uncharacterized protein n=1 Tax=Puccinia coronata f. sp. avenae TaxID=200324 RepID=A0A2N5UHN6_9BASI|nr:hypothetical protein PCASD_09417 [Puccinia coronata f. sp. avenae]